MHGHVGDIDEDYGDETSGGGENENSTDRYSFSESDGIGSSPPSTETFAASVKANIVTPIMVTTDSVEVTPGGPSNFHERAWTQECRLTQDRRLRCKKCPFSRHGLECRSSGKRDHWCGILL
jgi:hypothetical protein